MNKETSRGARTLTFGFFTEEGIVWYRIDRETEEIVGCELEKYEEE